MINRLAIKIFFAVVTIGLLFVTGAIAWVHCYYLPHLVAEHQSTASETSTSTQSRPPMFKTAEAMIAIQDLSKGLPAGYLNLVPLPLALNPVSTTVSSTFSYLGLTFSVPWKGISKEKILGNPPVLPEITFSNGRSLTLMRAETPSSATLAQFTSASGTIKTDYDFENAVFNAVPDQVTSLTPGDEATLISLLLDSKLLLFYPSPVYSFDTETIRGFQHGDATTTKQIVIGLFDHNDNAYDLLLSGTKNEIDYVLESITSTVTTQ